MYVRTEYQVPDHRLSSASSSPSPVSEQNHRSAKAERLVVPGTRVPGTATIDEGVPGY